LVNIIKVAVNMNLMPSIPLC